MNRSPQHEIEAIDEEIDRLVARKQALQKTIAAPWPRRLMLYARCSKETNWEKGTTVGLTGEALNLFVHFEEVALEAEVAEDGIVTVLACNGRPVQPQKTQV